MRLIILDKYDDVSDFAAKYLIKQLREFGPGPNKLFTLGLPTGGTPLGMYRKLIEYHKEGKISFKYVRTFNMDEYVGLPRDHPESYHSFMFNNFFRHIDIDPKNVHILDGNASDLEKECQAYEQALSKEEPKTYKCDLRNRPKPEECINKPASGTCGYYTKDCPFEICGLQTYNGCAACSDPNVLYYTKEDCKPEELVQTCNKDICQGLPDEEKKVYEPVCGIRKDYRNKLQTQTFDNYCKACQNSKYPWYQAGVCKEDRHYCNARRPTTCNAQYKPVCAHFTLNDFGSVYTTASNSCEACSDRTVDYYTDGECGEARNEETYCLPNNRPDFCTEEYNPVCGFYKQKDGSIAHKIVGNACSACADPSILYHIPGPCVFKCNRDPNIIFDCAGVFEPVCGKYTQRGKTYSVSLRNSCIGCYYSGKPIETYTDGLCPGDKGIRCENDAGAFLEGILFPVCGYEKEKCSSDSCRETYAEPILACTNTDTIWYSAGACPGDKGVSCDDYREKPRDGFEFVYEKVCGFSGRGKRNYKDQYDACENSYVQYFIKGPC